MEKLCIQGILETELNSKGFDLVTEENMNNFL